VIGQCCILLNVLVVSCVLFGCANAPTSPRPAPTSAAAATTIPASSTAVSPPPAAATSTMTPLATSCRASVASPSLYLKHMAASRGDRSEVIVALWETGWIVWSRNGEYVTTKVDEVEAVNYAREAQSLGLAEFPSSSYAVPSSSWWEIAIQRKDGSLARYIWNESVDTLPSDIGDRFPDAWARAKALLQGMTPTRAVPLRSQPEALAEFKRAFPGLFVNSVNSAHNTDH